MSEITLIIPAKNEPNALPMVLKELEEKNYDFEKIIVVDEKDNNTINSIKKFKCKIIFQTKKGFGNAIIEGIKNSSTTYSCIFFADGSTDPKYISLMLNKLNAEKKDIIFGSRYEKDAYTYDDDFITRIGNFFFTFLGNFLMNFKISDLLYTYIFGKTISLKKLNLSMDDYCLCVEIPFNAKKYDLTYDTIPCVERKRFADKKKVKAFSDGFKILFYFMKRLLETINKK